jgi:hypothetical protein
MKEKLNGDIAKSFGVSQKLSIKRKMIFKD